MPTNREIIVVTGLPRSGTSMMMRMLGAGGVRLVTDDHRRPDTMNPHGYFESADVRTIAQHSDFISGAEGAAIKIVFPLTEFLPDGFTYKIIAMRRNLRIVANSQSAMSVARGCTPPDDLLAILEHQLRLAETSLSRFPHTWIDYEWVVSQPRQAAQIVAEFLGQPLDDDAMTAMVDSKLAVRK